MKTQKKAESGQIIVLLAAAIVVLLAFAALAIDVGMVYSDRRYDQSVADASALAGAQAAFKFIIDYQMTDTNFTCSGANGSGLQTAATNAAVARALVNHFSISPATADHGAVVTCVNSMVGATPERHLEVKVTISSTTQTNFAHLFFGGTLRNTVTATARVKPAEAASYGYALVGTKQSCQNANDGAINFNGSVETIVDGGGIFSNGCLSLTGSVASVNVNNKAGPFQYNLTLNDNNLDNNPKIYPYPQDANSTLNLGVIPDPAKNCGPARTIPAVLDGSQTLQPGTYTAPLRLQNSSDVALLAPGLYCFQDDVSINGGSLSVATGGDSLSGVTIYMMPGGSKSATYFDVGSGGSGAYTVNLQAPKAADTDANNTPHNPPALNGVVIYVAANNQCGTTASKCVDITGNATTSFRGTIYAPSGEVRLSGTAGFTSSFGSSVIGATVTINGNSGIHMLYNAKDNYMTPNRYSLWQ